MRTPYRKIRPNPFVVFQLCAIAIAVLVFLIFIAAKLIDISASMKFSDLKILACFLVYVASLLFFSIIYLVLYRQDKLRFSIANDLTTKKIQDYKPALERSKIQKAIAEKLISANDGGREWKEISVEQLPGGIQGFFNSAISGFSNIHFFSCDDEFCVTYSYMTQSQRTAEFGVGLLLGRDGKQVGSAYLYPFYSIDSFSLAEFLQDALCRCAQQIAYLERSEFSLFDFIYFSTITQTTVGFGDIVPNSTIVRFVVVTQILVGYLLLAVLINLSFNR